MNVVNTKKKNSNSQPVQVFIRPRPLNLSERTIGCSNVIQCLLDQKMTLRNGLVEKSFHFDRIFRPEASQKYVYETTVAPLIDSCVSGYNCTVFAYGQTGTGKTHTMTGQDMTHIMEPQGSAAGIIPRAIFQLFETLGGVGQEIEFTVRVSFIEIYNEEVRDLLAVDTTSMLRIYDDRDNKGSICVRDLHEATVCNTNEALACLQAGTVERHTAATKLNVQSSRSHSIFTITVHTRQITVDGDEIIKTGKLNLVDLAGSENIGRSGATEVRAREAGTINKSLLTLGKVIKALAQKLQYIPYRDSKLTRILQDSLGGKTKTCMIAMISPALNAWDETLSTLDYANVARCVSNCPQVNENRNKGQVLTHFKDEITKLQRELAASRACEGFYITRESYETMNMELEQQREHISEKKRRESEMAAKIQEMQEWRDVSEARQIEIQASFDRTKAYLEQAKIDGKKHKYLYNCVEKKCEQLEKTAHSLLDIVKVSTTNESVYHKIYKQRCDISMKNASTAQRISSYCKNTLAQLQNNANSMSNKQQDNLKNLKHLNTKTGESVDGAFLKLSQIEANLHELANNQFDFYSNLNVCGMASEEEARKTLFQLTRGAFKQVDVELDEYLKKSSELHDTMIKTIADGSTLMKSEAQSLESYFLTNAQKENDYKLLLVKNGREKIAEAEKLREQNQNFKKMFQALKSQVDAISKEIEDNGEKLDLHTSEIEKFVTNSINHFTNVTWQDCPKLFRNYTDKEQTFTDSIIPQVETLNNKANECNSLVKEVLAHGVSDCCDRFTEILHDFNEAIETKEEIVKNQLGTIASGISKTDDNHNEIKKYIDECDKGIRLMRKTEKTHHSDLTKFIQENVKTIDDDLKENVDYTNSAGETPKRQVHRIPLTIEPRTPANVLIERFETNHLDDSVSLVENPDIP